MSGPVYSIVTLRLLSSRLSILSNFQVLQRHNLTLVLLHLDEFAPLSLKVLCRSDAA